MISDVAEDGLEVFCNIVSEIDRIICFVAQSVRFKRSTTFRLDDYVFLVGTQVIIIKTYCLPSYYCVRNEWRFSLGFR